MCLYVSISKHPRPAFVICPTHANPQRYGLVFGPDSPPRRGCGVGVNSWRDHLIVWEYIYEAFFMLASVVTQFVSKDEWRVRQNTAKPYRASEHSELENDMPA